MSVHSRFALFSGASKWALAGAIALSVLVATGAAQTPPRLDFKRVAPEDLRYDPPTAALRLKVQDAYAAKRYEEAAKGYLELARRRPDSALDLYNLACCYGLLGRADQAAMFLRASWAAGFQDLEQIHKDADFDGVRSAPAFKTALSSLKEDADKRGAIAGKVLDVATPVLQRVRVLEPKGYRAGKKVPLVVALHGAGGEPGHIVRFFAEEASKRGFLLCVPTAPYALPVGEPGETSAGLGYVWFPRGPYPIRTPPLDLREPAEDYLLKVLQAVSAAYGVDEANVFLVGFSQGAYLAYWTGLRHPELFRGTVSIGGWANAGDFTAEEASAAKGARALVCHSPEDRAVSLAEGEASASLLEKWGANGEVLRYPGGHVLTPDLAKGVGDWMTRNLARSEEPAQAAP